uniref:UDP-glucuronosyltransferase n=1 Tax=Culicoides sonorensis TaxID=179676 RepID=A0A336MSB5_CULSO
MCANLKQISFVAFLMQLRNLILIILFICETTLSYRILGICPTPAKSHQMFFHTIMGALADNGHELVLLTTDPFETNNPNITQIDWSESYQSDFANTNWKEMDSLKVIKLGLHDAPGILDDSLSHLDVVSLIKNYQNEHFDAVIAEYIGNTPMYAFAELFNAPLIGFNSLEIDAYQHEIVGNAMHPVLHSPNMFGYYSGDTLFKRVCNTLWYLIGKVLYKVFDTMFNNLIHKHFGARIKSNSVELTKSVDLLLTSSSPFLGFTRPTVAFTVPIPFLHIKPRLQPLPEKLNKFLNAAHDGAIYFSFGTMVKLNNNKDEMISKFLNAFKDMPYKVLMKNNLILNSNDTNKIMTSNWFPQQEVLAHKNIKLFITQGGLPSIQESVYYGIPLIVVPFLADQFDNAAIVEEKGIGKAINAKDLSVATIKKTIKELIQNPKYKQNVLNLSQVVKDEQVSPRAKAVWWIEFTIRNRNMMKHLKYKGVELSFVQTYFIDVILVFLIIFLVLIFITKKLLKSIKEKIGIIKISIKWKRA